jgi:peptidoglycan/xylan/chitin deacetylase (PgdA/CDA1 family)
MKKIIFAILFLISFSFGFEVKNYRVINGCFYKNSKEFAALREFYSKNNSYILAVNTSTLKTKIFPKSTFKYQTCKNSRYKRVLNDASSAPFPLQNDGIKGAKSGIFLTTDLCPSRKKGYEKRLYQALIKNFYHPVPVTLFITKRWIQKHQKSFNELKNWAKKRDLDITWGNHTAYHHYSPKAPFSRNFVLLPHENLKKDILDLEIELLKRGVKPSVFFRFPGLVSDKKSVDEVKKLGLIIIGSNTWLAKGEKIKNGSIILVHGNKNEPKGVDLLLKAIKAKKIKQLFPISSLEPKDY